MSNQLVPLIGLAALVSTVLGPAVASGAPEATVDDAPRSIVTRVVIDQREHSAGVGFGETGEYETLAAFTLGSDALFARPAAERTTARQSDASLNIRLAEAFTAALNGHEVDTLVDLFTDEDSGPTLSADVYAWHKFEIRQWALQQVRASIRVSAYGYRVTEHGAIWSADVYRGDWAEVGVSALQVWNAVWVHNGKLAHFSSRPRDAREVERLGSLWRPGSRPDIGPPELNGARNAST